MPEQPNGRGREDATREAVELTKALLADATREVGIPMEAGAIAHNTELSEAEAEAALEALRRGDYAVEGETLVIHHGEPPRYEFEPPKA